MFDNLIPYEPMLTYLFDNASQTPLEPLVKGKDGRTLLNELLIHEEYEPLRVLNFGVTLFYIDYYSLRIYTFSY
jgi:hypothetical protein